MNESLSSEIAGSSSIVELLIRRALAHPQRTFCTYSDEGTPPRLRWTYADLDAQARRIGSWLQSRNLAGQPVLLAFPPGLDFVTAFFGCLYAGAIAVPSPPPRRNPKSDRFFSIYKDCKAECVFTTADVLDRVQTYAKTHPALATVPWQVLEGIGADSADAWQDPGVSLSTIAFLQYTSGSTGDPKGVVVDHGNLLHNQKLITGAFGQTEEMVTIGWLPMHHDMGLVGTLLHPLSLGGTLHLMSPMGFLQNPIRWLNLISELRGTITTAPNFAYELCITRTTPEERTPLDLSCLQTALNGAEPVRASTLRRFSEVFAPQGFRPSIFCPCYGMAETTLLISGVHRAENPLEHIIERQAANPASNGDADHALNISPDCPAELVHCGTPHPDLDVRIVDPETFTERPDGEIGEIWVSGPSVTRGYWHRPELTKDTFQAEIHRDRSTNGNGTSSKYFRTGDLGLKQAGRLYIAGRFKDVIILNGVNYYPHDLEASAVACDDRLVEGRGVAFGTEIEGGEEVVLVLEVKREHVRQLDEDILTNILTEIQQTWEISPAAVLLVRPGSVPVTTSGKVQRQLVKQQFLAGELSPITQWNRPRACRTSGRESAAEPMEPRTQTYSERESLRDLERWMAGRLSQILEVPRDAIDIREPFARYGFKSQHAVQFCADLEQRVHRRIEPALAYDYPNIAELAKFLHSGNDQPRLQNGRAAHRRKDRQEPIAIIGIGCRFPGANNPEEFWELLRSGQSALRPYPRERWGEWQQQLAESASPGHPLPPLGGFLDHAEDFDPLFFGISPREVETLDPQQRLVLEVCWQALEHAGLPADQLARQQTGVFLGVSGAEYAHLQARLNCSPTGYNATGNSLAMIANRLSYTLDLHGPSLAFDTACSSSLVAVHAACESLKRGECEVAICGGVSLITSPAVTASLNQAGMLSPTGAAAAFTQDVDGYVRGEGCGIVIAKRLSRAVADHDRIIAVVAGSAINHDGRSNGLTAPNGRAQQSVLQQALANADCSPGQIDYLEAHGTGTVLGDQIEVNALRRVFWSETDPEKPLRIGSVKSNIGHLEAAAGIAGFIKVCLSLQHEELPKHVCHQPLNEPLLSGSNLQVVQDAALWPRSEQPRHAGVSSFGFGGTNAHVVLKEAPGPKPATPFEPPTHILVLSAKTESALHALAQNWQQQFPEGPLPAICYTANAGRARFPHRLALVADRREDFQNQLGDFLRKVTAGKRVVERDEIRTSHRLVVRRRISSPRKHRQRSL